MNRFALLAGTAAAIFAASSFAGQVSFVSEHLAAKSWVPAPGQARVVAGYPANAVGKERDVCVNIGYLIKPDGSTANFTQLKTWSSSGGDEPAQREVEAYVQLAAAAVTRWRFVRAQPKAHSIYTSATFAFEGSRLLSAEDIRARCRIADLLDYIGKATVATTNRRWIFRRSDRLRTSDSSAIEPFRPDYH
jgi:hypothetical protein